MLTEMEQSAADIHHRTMDGAVKVSRSVRQARSGASACRSPRPRTTANETSTSMPCAGGWASGK